MTRVSKTADPTQLLWVAPPDFLFIDADLNTHKPGTAVPGSPSPRQRPGSVGATDRPIQYEGNSPLLMGVGHHYARISELLRIRVD